MNRLIQLIHKYNSVAKFFVVGILASAVHGAISWMFYYHIWGGFTILSTFIGYVGGWLVSYLGNRLWSFRIQSTNTEVVSSAYKFIISQLVAMCVLLSSTWLVQQMIILYFWWYLITNNLIITPEMELFCAGASYPPALLSGMLLAAIASYLMMSKFVFKK